MDLLAKAFAGPKDSRGRPVYPGFPFDTGIATTEGIPGLARGLPTINFRVDYLRPAIKTGLTITAKVRRAGKSVGVVDVDVFNDQKALLAVGRATYSTLAA